MLLLLLFTTNLWAQSFEGAFAPPKNMLSLSARSSLEQHQVLGQVIAYKEEPHTLTFGFRYSSLDARPIDKKLYVEDVTIGYSKNLEGKRRAGGRLMIGSQSDKPFANSNVLAIFATAFYGYPVSENAQWMISMNYSNIFSFWSGIPFPGANYFYRSPKWIIFAGVPANSVTWISEKGYTLSATLLGINALKLEAAYGNPNILQYFTSFEWNQSAFLLKEREQKKDRLFYDEKRASVGTRIALREKLKLDVRGGYAFDRSFFTAQSYRDKAPWNTFRIEDS